MGLDLWQWNSSKEDNQLRLQFKNVWGQDKKQSTEQKGNCVIDGPQGPARRGAAEAVMRSGRSWCSVWATGAFTLHFAQTA